MSQDEYKGLLDKLQEAMKGNEKLHVLSSDEVKTLRNMIETYRLFLGWGKLGRIVIWVLLTAAAVITAWKQIGVGQ